MVGYVIRKLNSPNNEKIINLVSNICLYDVKIKSKLFLVEYCRIIKDNVDIKESDGTEDQSCDSINKYNNLLCSWYIVIGKM